ncbi:MAG: hypothetical protein JSR98_00510 [Proteobacteria bacterium]|nr:hypothetical protein [Pseudomonadota bacterium]
MGNPFEAQLRAFGIPMKDATAEGPNDAPFGGTGAPLPPVSTTSDLLPPKSAWDSYATPIPPGATTPGQGGGDIFVGGGADDIMPGGGLVRGYADAYRAETGRPTVYLPNARIGQVVDAIRDANLDGGPVNVVGHSWGGPDAYNAVAQATGQGLRVDNLITLDPVKGPIGEDHGPHGAGRWLNVQASPSRPDYTDWLANRPPFSAKPSGLPVAAADQNVGLDVNHRDVDAMMRFGGARDLLDQSRSANPPPTVAAAPVSVPAQPPLTSWPTAQQLHDNQPMMDWIRARQAQVRGR